MIEVRIDPSELLEMMPLGSEREWEWYCMARLRRAGIPIRGALVFRGVENGVLMHHRDLDTNEEVYRWQ